MSLLLRPVNPAFSRQVAAGVLMDTQDMRLGPAPTLSRFPGGLRSLEEVAHSLYGAGGAWPVPVCQPISALVRADGVFGRFRFSRNAPENIPDNIPDDTMAERRYRRRRGARDRVN